MAIVLWIGIVITAQAFQASPLRHAPAAAIGLFPAIAAWGSVIVSGALIQAQVNAVKLPVPSAPVVQSVSASAPHQAPAARSPEAPAPVAVVPTMEDLLNKNMGTDVNGFLLHGMNIMERGYIFTCMIIAAISAFLIDRRFYQAAWWSVAAAVLTFVGLMHAYQVRGNWVDFWLIFTRPSKGAFTYNAYPLVIGYLLMAGVFFLMGYRHRDEQIGVGKTLEDARVAASEDLSGESFPEA